MRIVLDIADNTQSVLYQFNKGKLQSFLEMKENAIIINYFLTLMIEVLQQYTAFKQQEDDDMMTQQIPAKSLVSSITSIFQKKKYKTKKVGKPRIKKVNMNPISERILQIFLTGSLNLHSKCQSILQEFSLSENI